MFGRGRMFRPVVPVEQIAVFEDAVVIDGDGDEHHAAGALPVVMAQDVIEEAEPGFTEPPVAAELSFGKNRLADAIARGQMNVPFEHLAIKRVAGVPAHEERAHGPDQRFERKDPRPFAYRIRQRRAFRGEIAHQYVIHVAAMVHDENHRRFRVELLQSLGMRSADADAIDEARNALGEPVEHPIVDVGVERRHDLPGEGAYALLQNLTRDVLLAGGFLQHRQHVLIENQLVDQHLAAGLLQGPDLDLQAGVDAIDGDVEPAAQKPAHAGEKNAHDHGVSRQPEQDEVQPERNGHVCGKHVRSMPEASGYGQRPQDDSFSRRACGKPRSC